MSYRPSGMVNKLAQVDASLLYYSPDNDYESENMDNYMRRSLMDKGPEAVVWEKNEIDPRAQREFSQKQLDFRYNPERLQSQRKSELDLNDYTKEFMVGEDGGTMQQKARRIATDRIKKYETFKRDTALTEITGKLHPIIENRNEYNARLSALKMRQEFYNEKMDILFSSYKPVKKGRLGYDPERNLAIEDDANNYLKEGKAFMLSHGRSGADQIKAEYQSTKDQHFDRDELLEIVRGVKSVKARNVGSMGIAADTESFDNENETMFDVLRKFSTATRKKSLSKMHDTDENFREEESRVGQAMRYVSQRAQVKSSRATVGDEQFNDDYDTPIRSSKTGQNLINKFKAHSTDQEEVNDEIETRVNEVLRETRKLSKFYHEAHDQDTTMGDDVTVQDTKAFISHSGRVERRNDDIDNNFDDSETVKGVFNYRTGKPGPAINPNVQVLANYDDSETFTPGTGGLQRRQERNDYSKTNYRTTDALDPGVHMGGGVLSKKVNRPEYYNDVEDQVAY